MLKREALTQKIIVLGVDGFEPRMAKKFMDAGKMPNLKTFVNRGACREDLVLLGAMPTVTPPMWTTLSTGAYPATHGIYTFSNNHPTKIDTRIYSLDSRMCKAEPVWNAFVEAGWRALVWHWPGSSWPPTSTDPKLAVVDGAQPPCINNGVALVDWETIELADESIDDLRFTAYDAGNNPGIGCVITGLDENVADENTGKGAAHVQRTLGTGSLEYTTFQMDETDIEMNTLGEINLNIVNSPIKKAEGWANAPADAKEIVLLTSNGFIRRPALILKNSQGVYDRVAIYKSKKDTEPLAVLDKDVYVGNVVDEVIKDDMTYTANRNMRVIELAEDGSRLRLWMSVAFDVNNDSLWHPKSLHEEIVNNVGLVPPVSLATGKVEAFAEKLLLASWDTYCDWQANSLKYFIDNDKFDLIFSHLHNLDLVGHQCWHYAKGRDTWPDCDPNYYQKLIEQMYQQTDKYLGEFVKYLDEGWTVIITSDHGLIIEENHPPSLGEAG